MASPKCSYSLAPAWCYQVDGPIALGSIITDPRSPEDPLNSGSKINLPTTNVDSVEIDYRAVISQNRNIDVGLSASVLSFFGLGGSFGVHTQKD
jgi:hypothetical protein